MKAVAVQDPAQVSPDAVATQAADRRWAGAEYSISVTSGNLSDGSYSCASVHGSNGQHYTPVVDGTITAGTNFVNGQITLTAGQSATDWVMFQVPPSVTVTATCHP